MMLLVPSGIDSRVPLRGLLPHPRLSPFPCSSRLSATAFPTSGGMKPSHIIFRRNNKAWVPYCIHISSPPPPLSNANGLPFFVFFSVPGLTERCTQNSLPQQAKLQLHVEECTLCGTLHRINGPPDGPHTDCSLQKHPFMQKFWAETATPPPCTLR
eukprot:NODE_2909_length_483_cov_1.831461_g2859_i0.p1 GENE.NODE_2909_length_483_cov_1.831461_g2859_i0~~NODE_2909_length_483_cov_1.831461_g2859_i0.p1  ORF type:complete len:156 (-),score=9.64 NODE_2909_length_483_cov_1.831461_g2859_i0:5-472(-)